MLKNIASLKNIVSLRLKILIHFLVLVVICGGIISFIHVRAQQSFLHQQVVEKWQAKCELLSDNLATAIYFEQRDTVKELLASMKSEKEFIAAMIFDSNGKVYASEAVDSESLEGMQNHIDTPVLSGDEEVSICRKIRFKQESIGSLVVKVSLVQVHKQIAKAQSLAIIVFFFVVCFCGVLSYILAGTITKPLMQLNESVQRLKAGDFSVRVEIEGRDEISQVAETFNDVASNLQEVSRIAQSIAEGDLSVKVTQTGELAQAMEQMLNHLKTLAHRARGVSEGDLSSPVEGKGDLVESFKYMIRGLQSITRGVKSAASDLTSAAAQILATTTELTTSATEQATAIAETTATMNELRQTAEQAAERASKVIELTKLTKSNSSQGLEAADTSVKDIGELKEQVDAISQKIASLSEQTERIGEIISTVTDIADQSNLLALNASIEAARAGEQGRGFSVVADEVKNLAMESKAATIEIKAMLNSIQGSTGEVVHTMQELSVKAEKGFQQASRTGELIRNMVDTIEKSSSSAMKIAIVSREQTVGIDQIAQAMEEINQSTKGISNAMQETKVAAEQLTELSETMLQMIGQYRV